VKEKKGNKNVETRMGRGRGQSSHREQGPCFAAREAERDGKKVGIFAQQGGILFESKKEKGGSPAL